jgi:hypothetical protein
MLSIPIDILWLILKHVDKATLVKMCKLNKICCSCSQDVLYRDIRVDRLPEGTLVFHTLAQSTHLARRVRSFELTIHMDWEQCNFRKSLQNMTCLRILRIYSNIDFSVLEGCTFKLLSFTCSFFKDQALNRFLLKQSSIADLEAYFSTLYDWPELGVTFLPNLTRVVAPFTKLPLLVSNRPVKEVSALGYNIEDDDLSFLTLSAIPIQKLTVEHMYLYPKPGQFLASLVPSLTHLGLKTNHVHFNNIVCERPFFIDFNTQSDYYRVTLISPSGSKTYSLPWCHSEFLGLRFILTFAVLQRGIFSVLQELPIGLRNLNTLQLQINVMRLENISTGSGSVASGSFATKRSSCQRREYPCVRPSEGGAPSLMIHNLWFRSSYAN